LSSTLASRKSGVNEIAIESIAIATEHDGVLDLHSPLRTLTPRNTMAYAASLMRIRYAAKTDVGMKRNHNEDYFSLIEDEQLFLVADGMGGHASGEVASKMAADVMQEFFVRTKDDDATWPYKMDRHLSYVENRLVVGIKMANQRIFQAACRDVKYKGMGTTIVSGQVVGDKFYIAHVGDSRCYRIRAGSIQQMTRDHSLLEDYKDAKPNMSEEEQKKFPHKNVITRALGMRETVQVDVLAHDIQDKDVFLLCSDGLSGMIEDDKLLEVVKTTADLESAVSSLVEAANQAGGTDNITVLALQCAN
jgi:serine/threonine protein phosphatase PrpC